MPVAEFPERRRFPRSRLVWGVPVDKIELREKFRARAAAGARATSLSATENRDSG
jgi:hypothetical protein